MYVKDLRSVLDNSIGIWVNQNEHSDYYCDYDDLCRLNPEACESEILYLTINARCEFVIEI